MNRLSNLNSEIVDVIGRIERLTELEQLHISQPQPDKLALDGYQQLRRQYIQQLEELLSSLNIQAEIHLKAT